MSKIEPREYVPGDGRATLLSNVPTPYDMELSQLRQDRDSLAERNSEKRLEIEKLRSLLRNNQGDDWGNEYAAVCHYKEQADALAARIAVLEQALSSAYLLLGQKKPEEFKRCNWEDTISDALGRK